MYSIHRWIRRHRTIGAVAIAICLAVATVAPAADAQSDPDTAACVRIMAQDDSLNNLVDPSGYTTAPANTLGGVLRAGTGDRSMILIPGLGFGGDVFEPFMADFADDYRMFAVTLAGFGGTAAPPSPPAGTSFGAQTWTNGALAAIEHLIADEQLTDIVVVGHWLTGTQLALRLAMKHPEAVRAVVLLAGAPHMVSTDPAGLQYIDTLEKRIAAQDQYMGPMWFKTVTRETWDDNNFLPGDYAVNPVMGLRLWRRAAEPPLHVWVRYLCEFNAQDVALEIEKVRAPILLVKPGLKGLYHDPGQNYLTLFCDTEWDAVAAKTPTMTVTTIPNARVCLWHDQPAAVRNAVGEFLGALK